MVQSTAVWTTAESTIARIAGAGKLVAIFGYWPSFHDAEVIRLSLERTAHDASPSPTLEALIHTWEITPEVDPSDFCVLRHQVLVHLRFLGIENLQLDGFNHQNVLFGLRVSYSEAQEDQRRPFHVEFNASFGAGAAFHCRAVEVVSVTPYQVNCME